MLNHFLPIVLLVVSFKSSFCLAQNKIQYGFSGSFNSSRMINKADLDTSQYRPFLSPSVGSFLSLNFYGGLAFDCGFSYALSGGIHTTKTDSFSIRQRLLYHYIHLPISLRYIYKNFVYARLGIYAAVLTNAYVNQRFVVFDSQGRKRHRTKRKVGSEVLREASNPFDFGFLIGGGMQFADGFSVEISYRKGIRSVGKKDAFRNSVFTVGLNYTINYSQKTIYRFGSASRHVFYTELGGASLMSSLNYEYVLTQHSNIRFAGRLGIGAGYMDSFVPEATSILVGLVGILGKRNHHFEFGYMHTTVAHKFGAKNFAFLSGGYRFHKPNGGLFLRIAYTPKIANYNPKKFNHWAGVGVGYVFKTRLARS